MQFISLEKFKDVVKKFVILNDKEIKFELNALERVVKDVDFEYILAELGKVKHSNFFCVWRNISATKFL